MQERLQHFVAYVCASEKRVSHLLLGFGILFPVTLLLPGWLVVPQVSSGEKAGQQSRASPAWSGNTHESLWSLLRHCACGEHALQEVMAKR